MSARKAMTVRLTPEVYKGLRHAAIELDLNLQEAVGEALEEWVARRTAA